MIHLPGGFTNTTAVLAPGTGLVAATSVPNLFYESTPTAVFSNHLPVLGYSAYRLPAVLPSLAVDDCSCLLKKRVQCQIAKAEAAEALAKVEDECSECCTVSRNCYPCCCVMPTVTQLVTVPHIVRQDHSHQHQHSHDFHHYHHDRQSRADKAEEAYQEKRAEDASRQQAQQQQQADILTLDEKIRRIRHELNLPNEKELTEMCREMERKTKVNYHEHCVPTAPVETQKKTVVVRARSRSKSAERSKSRSRSANLNDRPAWRPTGGNVYTRPHTELVLNRNSTEEKKDTTVIPCQPQPCREYVYYVEPTRLPREAYYTVCEPAKTTIKTTVNTSTNNNTGCNNNYSSYQARSSNWCKPTPTTTVTKYDCVPTSYSSYLPSINQNKTTYYERPATAHYSTNNNAYYTTSSSSKEPATVYYC